MDRRTFVKVIGGSLIIMPVHPDAQQPAKLPRLGVLLYNPLKSEPVAPLVEDLQKLGYVDGKTIAIEYRSADGKPERLPDLAAELVRLKPDVIFALGGDVAPFAQRATATIPIVAWVSNDPVESGLVSSVGRPGANITGVTLVYDDLAGKTLALLREAVPGVTHVSVLWNPDHADPEYRETRRAAAALGIRLQSLEVRRASDFEGAFKLALAEHSQGLIIVPSRLMSLQRQEIAEFTARNRIVWAGGWGAWTNDGALLTYGPNAADMMRRVAVYVDKILKGARPADLPMERPTRFELVINLKTAKALGITIPQSLLLRADEVIQ